MKQYLVKFSFYINPESPDKNYALQGLVKPKTVDGRIRYEMTMVADEKWVKQNRGEDICLDGLELPDGIFETQLFGEEE